MTNKSAHDTKPDALRQVWGGLDRDSRPGPRKSFSLDAVLIAGVALYDAAGENEFSLAKLAKALGLTTNALYRYIGSREELDSLLRDQALGEPSLKPAEDWREMVREWTRALARRYELHPWLAYVPIRIPFTPNALAWLDVLLKALELAGLDRTARLNAAGLLDSHVRACAVATLDLSRHGSTQVPQDLGKLLQERGLDAVADVVQSGLYLTSKVSGQDTLEFGVTTFLNGIEASVRS